YTCMIPRRRSPPYLPYTTLFRSFHADPELPEAHPAAVGRHVVQQPAQAGLEVVVVGGRGQHPGRVALEHLEPLHLRVDLGADLEDRKSTRLNSSHVKNSYAVYCL